MRDVTSTRTARLRAQRLDPASRQRSSSVAEVTRDVAGLQAQDDRAAALGIRVRSRGLTRAAIAAARGTDRSIVRAWCMRGTLHLVAASDLRDLLAVFGPVYVPRGRRRLAQFGLDDEMCDRAMRLMRDELGERGPLTRHEIAAALAAAGVPADAHRQAPVHLVARACLLGIACEAGSGEGEPVYTLIDRWIPAGAARERPVALAALARRYLAAHQPAGRDDFAAWAGLPAADVRTAWDAISGELEPVDDADPGLWRLEGSSRSQDPEPAAPVVRLLPAFDNYLLGYRRRDHAVDPAHWPAVHPGGGIIRPTVLVDGTAVATWRIDRSRRSTRVVVQPFAPISAAEDAVQAEAADVGRFLDGTPYQASWTRTPPT